MASRSIWNIGLNRAAARVNTQTISSTEIELHLNIKECVNSLFPIPTKVQKTALPFFMKSYFEDLVICAPPQTGKTVCTVIGILNSFLISTDSYSLAILLAPTYEIAESLYTCCQKCARFCDVFVYLAVKGKRLTRDNKNPKEIFIGTAEKILELSRSSVLRLRKASFLLVDEVDCLSNPKKYFNDISLIHEKLAKTCRKVLCTTYVNDNISDFIEKYMYCQITINVEDDKNRKFPIKRICIIYRDRNREAKENALAYLLSMKDFQGQVIVFCERIDTVTQLGETFHEMPNTSILTGNLLVSQRKTILANFKEGIIKVLITTHTFLSIVPAGSTKLIHYDQILDEKELFDLNVYRKREYLLSITEKCLISYFIEENWVDHLLDTTKTGYVSFKDLDKIAAGEIQTYFS